MVDGVGARVESADEIDEPDILFLNGESLLHLPVKKRREVLEKNVKVIRNHIEVSEQYRLTKLEDLTKLMSRVLREGLEGLVVKVCGWHRGGERIYACVCVCWFLHSFYNFFFFTFFLFPPQLTIPSSLPPSRTRIRSTSLMRGTG